MEEFPENDKTFTQSRFGQPEMFFNSQNLAIKGQFSSRPKRTLDEVGIERNKIFWQNEGCS